MSENTRYLKLAGMLNPGSIAFVGDTALEPIIAYAREIGFSGDYFIINPSLKKLAGLDCIASAADLPAPPELAFVAALGQAAIDAVRDLSSAGIGGTIVSSPGFSEAGDAGARLESELLAAAGEMPILGPNCPGICNFLDRVGAMSEPMSDFQCERGVAIISNGGAYLSDLAGAERSLPIAYLAGIGNQANISMAELLEVLLDDNRISAINLHFESIRDVSRLALCALKAHQKGIPVVALKAGKTMAGSRAAQMHTTSVSADAQIASTLFARFGFVEVDSASEALETLKMLSLAAAPNGPRVAYATGSVTHAVMGADFAERQGLVVAPVSDATRDILQPLIGDLPVAENPLDAMRLQGQSDEAQQAIFSTFLEDAYDIALQTISFPLPGSHNDERWYRMTANFARAAHSAGLPTAFVSPTQEGLPLPARQYLIEQATVPLQGFEDGMKAIAHALAWHRMRKQLVAENILLPTAPAELGTKPSVLDEVESKSMLAAFGIPIPQGERWSAQAELPENLDYPVVLKICDAAILHKSAVGGVRLSLVSPELLRFARSQMIAVVCSHGHEAENFLVEELISGSVAELIVAIRRIPGVGLSLRLAIGGKSDELTGDAANLLLPSNRAAIADALAGLKRFPTLAGVHGNIGADIDSTLDAIEAIAAFAESRNDIVELEISPLILRAGGYPAVAADASLKIQAH